MTSMIILFWCLLNNQRQIKLKTHKKRLHYRRTGLIFMHLTYDDA